MTLGAGTATQLTLTTEPSPTATSGAAFGQQPVLQVRDGAGNPAGGAGVGVTAVIASGPAGATLANATATTLASGAAASNGLPINGSAGDYTLRFESAGVRPATLSTITLGAGTATQLTITTEPSPTATSGAAFGQQPVLQVRDAAGNPAGGAGVPVTAVIASGPAGATLTNATATTIGSGAATFNGLAINGSAGSYTLRFESGTLTPATSGTITLGAGTATQLTITTQPPATAASGAALNQQPVIQVRDAVGNPAGGAGVQVTAVIASGPAGATLSNATATTLASGAATFSGLAITGAAGDYTLRFETAGLTPATSSTITLGAGTATQLTLTTEPPPTATSGAAFGQQPVLQVRDGAGNPAGGAGVGVTAVIASGPAGATLANATATTLASGAATFNVLTINVAAGDYTLRFDSAPPRPASAPTITLGAGTATQLTLTTEPSPTATSGAAFGQQPVLQVRDGAGNPAGGAGVGVTAVIASGPAGATLANATATTLASGAATFNVLTINVAAGDYTLRFDSAPPRPASAPTITLGAGTATQLTLTTEPSPTATSGAAFGQQPVLQ